MQILLAEARASLSSETVKGDATSAARGARLLLDGLGREPSVYGMCTETGLVFEELGLPREARASYAAAVALMGALVGG